MNPPSNIHDLPDDVRSTALAIDTLFDEIYLVGGAVRDAILGKETHDLDFSTPDSADDIYDKLIQNPLFKVHEEGRGFGTIAATIGEVDVQITTYRSETYMNNSRKPLVAPIIDIDSDLSRRDFTINAIALSREEIVDPYDGLEDIKRKTIRAIGDAKTRFREDPLRILRAFRFVATLGFEIEESTLTAVTESRTNISIVSRERIGIELQKLLDGKYWADALYEMSDAGVINIILEHLDINHAINPSDVMHEFEKYSADALESMELPRRWQYLIDILYYAAKSNGAVSVSSKSLAEKLLNSVQLNKNIKSKTLSLIDEVLDSQENSVETRVYSEQLTSMKQSYQRLKKDGDSRWMIAGARYFTEIGRQHLHENKYLQAKKNFEQAIEITEQNYNFLLSWDDAEKKAQKLRALKPYFLSRLRYLYIVLALNSKLLEKEKSINAVRHQLHKEYTTRHVSKHDIAIAVDRAIAHIYKLNLKHLTVEPFGEFLAKNSVLPEEDKKRYNREYIEQQLRDKSLPPEEKAELYHKKMDIASHSLNENEKLGLEYYDPYIDYLYNRMLSAKDIASFNELYNKYLEMAPKYQEIMSSQNNSWAGERNINLTAASAHVFALNLAKSVNEKLDISEKVVELYELSNSRLNAARYSIFVDWFSYAKTLLNSNYSTKTASDLLERLKWAKRSIRYIDSDEDYLQSQRPDIIAKRSLLRDSLSLIAALNDIHIQDITVKDKNISAIQTLCENGMLDKKGTFTLYKNVISKIEHQNLELNHIEQADRELAAQQDDELTKMLSGESEVMEYKASWRFDVERFRKTKKQKEASGDVTKSALKNIAGLMNKRGGILLLGVEDNCNVIGLENTDYLLSSNKDPRKILDTLQQTMRTDIINTLGASVYNKLQIDILKSQSSLTVIKITIPPADPSTPCLYKEGGNEFYYRRGGTTCENAGMQAAIDRLNSA